MYLAAKSSARATTRCVHGAQQRCSRCVVGDLTVLLRRPYGVPTAGLSQRRDTAHTLSLLKVSPWHGDRRDHTTSNAKMPRRCYCALGDHSSRTMAFIIFPGRRTVYIMTQLWCGIPLSSQLKGETNADDYILVW